MVKKVLFISSNIGIEHAALIEPIEFLKAQGFDVVHATETRADIETVEENIKPAFRYQSEMCFAEVEPEDYAALVIPGGVANANLLRINPQVLEYIQYFSDTKKIIAVSGHAAWALINAQRIKNKNLTAYENIRLDLENAGATWSQQDVCYCQCENWTLISTNATEDFDPFNQCIHLALNQES